MTETIFICTGGPKTWQRRILPCPTEGTRRRFVGFDQEWYGITWTCCGCGDSWSDGERMERPFARGWRERAMGRAKGHWDRVGADD